MKKYISGMAAMLAVLSLVACSEQEPEGGLSVVNRSLHISGASAGISTSVTRAGGTKELTDPADAIGVFLEGSSDYTAVNNKKFTYGSPVWTTQEQDIVLSTKPANLFAYYPFNENQNTWKVTLNSDVYAPEKEFYYQTFQASYTSSMHSLNLKRAYALIRFSFIRGEADGAAGSKGAYHGDGEVTAFQFTTQAIRRGVLDLLTNQLTGTVSQLVFANEAPEVPFTIGTKASPAQKNFLMVPVELFTEDVNLTTVVDGKSMSASVSAAALSGSEETLKAGYAYEIKIVVRPTALEIVGAGISQEAWDVTDINGELEIK